MKGTYHGLMSVDELLQAIFQDHTFFERHNITYIRSASLYFTPCDEHGRPVRVLDPLGNLIDGYISSGAYKSAADAYDEAQYIEPRPVTRPPSPTSVPFSPL